MKFAQELRRDEQPELLELYKKLKKSLKIFEGPSDAGSIVERHWPPEVPSSDSEEDDGEPSGSAAAPAAARQQHQQQQHQQQEEEAQGQPQAQGQQQGQQQQQGQHQQRAPPDPAQEARFTALVEQCVQQLNDDYLSREEMLVIKADLAQSAAYFAGSREALSAAYSGMVNLHGELVLLCHWSMTAYTGIVKILKKHYKRTGQRVQSALLANLLSQPFCSLEEVRGMVRAAESQMSSLAQRLGLAASHAPTAGAAAAAAVRDPSTQQPPAAFGGLLARGSPAVGESAGGGSGGSGGGGGVGDGLPALSSGQRAHSQAQRARPERARTAEVAVVAACGDAAASRPLLKRDRSKQYCHTNKRHEAGEVSEGGEEGGEEAPTPAVSSGMAVSQQGGEAAHQHQQQCDTASSGRDHVRSSIMQRTKAALQLWKALRSNASTPSTMVNPQGQQAPPPPAGSQ